MKSVSWLRDFVDVPVSPEELGETLTLRGFELSSIERANLVPSGSDPRTYGGQTPVRYRRRARFRSHRQQARCAQHHRLRARGGDGVLAAGQAARPEAAARRNPRPMSPSSSRRRTCARGTRQPSRMSRSRPRPPGSSPGCRPPACGPSTTWWTSPTTCCSSSASRCTPSIWRSWPAGRSASAAR